MNGEAIRKHMLDAHGMIVEEQMTRFVEKRLSTGDVNDFHVIGGDARTGVPVRKVVDIAGFHSLAQRPPE